MLFIYQLAVVFSLGGEQATLPSQKSFCQFIAAFNRQQFDRIYDGLSPGFQTQIDRAVCEGGLLHVYQTNGTVLSACIERQTADEGTYYAVAERGIFKVIISVDSLDRIDGLRIKQVEGSVSMPVAHLFFSNAPR